MIGSGTSEWNLPVSFYFLVDFQSQFDHFQTSFMEVSGLEMSLKGKNSPTDSGVWVIMPSGLQYGKITLKRPVDRADAFGKWIYKCLKADVNKKMIPYDMIIKLLDKDAHPLVSWKCSHAYPIKWSLGSLDSIKNGLAMETIIMGCNRIEYAK